MNIVIKLYRDIVVLVSGKWSEAVMLLFIRITLAGIFWRSGRTKIEEGSWFQLSENTLFQFADEPFNHVPVLPPGISAHFTTFAEHFFPVLLVIGLFTRLSALALLGMTIVIQIFVFPEAWWAVHSLWVSLAFVLFVRGGGMLSLDKLLTGRRT